MNTRIFFISILFLAAAALTPLAPIHAQQQTGSDEKSGRDARQEQQLNTTQEQKQDDALPFVDENGDGINDNARMTRSGDNPAHEAGQRLRERRRDHFIDNDGDGINDKRCSGMGIMQGKRRGQQKGGPK